MLKRFKALYKQETRMNTVLVVIYNVHSFQGKRSRSYTEEGESNSLYFDKCALNYPLKCSLHFYIIRTTAPLTFMKSINGCDKKISF